MTTNYDQWTDAVKATVQILKKRFNSLTAEEALDLATEIVKSVLRTSDPERKDK